jgi:RNA polymerase sigma-70 factor (ECF subfamily)
LFESNGAILWITNMDKPTEANTRRQWVLNAVEQFETVLLRYARRLTGGDWDRTCEAVQHTFLKLCQQPPEAIKENLAGWLCAVCRNKIFDDAKAFSRQSQLGELALAEQTAGDDGPAQQAERTELDRLIDQRVEALPAAQRNAIELWRTGIGYAEIAKVLNKDQTAIRVAVHRAIVALKSDSKIAHWLSDDAAPSPNGKPIQTKSQRRIGAEA